MHQDPSKGIKQDEFYHFSEYGNNTGPGVEVRYISNFPGLNGLPNTRQ